MRSIVLLALLAACTPSSIAEPPITPLAPTSAEAQSAATSIDAFAAEFHASLPKGGNLFYSPTSIALALSIAERGARGTTKEEIDKVLHSQADTHTYAALMARFSSSKSPEIGIANRLYMEGSFAVEPDFAKVAPMESADFIHAAEPARGRINAWVSDRTKTRIPELIGPNVLDDKTRFVIVNAIYFKGEWATRFDATRTKPETFHGAADVQAPMMHATLPASLGKHGDAQVLDLAYRAKDGPETSMTVILPDAGHSLGEIEAAYEKEGIAPFVASTSNQSKVDLWLPKMKMSTELELGKMLAQMGMPLAFSDDADFTGITRTEPTKISNVIHKAFVDVNEEGTEAAAATAIVGVEATAIEMPATFHADHPFLFFVRDRATGVILFAGRCASPV